MSESETAGVAFVIVVNEAAQEAGLSADVLARIAGKAADGGGGGSAGIAQGGGSSGTPAAVFGAVRSALRDGRISP